MAFIEFLVELEGYNISTSTVETLYFSRQGFTTKPDHTPADQFYENRLDGDIRFQSELFGSFRLIGSPVVSIGSITLNNSDGGLDYLDGYAFGGRPLNIYRMVGEDFDNRTAWLSGQIELSTVSYDNVVFTIRDKSFALDQNIQANLYLGNNSGGNGIEGDANLEGKPKPLTYGEVSNVTPVLVNASRAIYQVHDGAISQIENVYDGRTSYSFQENVADNGLLQSLNVVSGSYATCLDEGLIKIGNIPQRGITVDLRGDAVSGYVNRPGAIVRRIIENQTTLTSADLDGASFTAFDTAYNYSTGIYIDGERRVVDVISEVLGPLNFWALSRSGQLSIGGFELASGEPVEEYSIDETLLNNGNPVSRAPSADSTNGIPTYRAVYQYDRNYTVQSRDQLFQSVPLSVSEFVEQEYRSAVQADSGVQTLYPLAPELTFTSLFNEESDANTEANRVFNIYRTQRFFYRFTVSDQYSSELELNDVIRLIYPRFGLENGTLLRVTGISESALDGRAQITAFG